MFPDVVVEQQYRRGSGEFEEWVFRGVGAVPPGGFGAVVVFLSVVVGI